MLSVVKFLKNSDNLFRFLLQYLAPYLIYFFIMK